jgi:peptidoglycan/xylan/chitin deacetylase (PgdA/CDA1 family)
VGEGPWAGSAVAFTFTSDDGDSAANLAWRDVFQERGLRYTLFVISGQVGWSRRLSASDLLAFHESGFEIASHSRTHVKLTDVDEARRGEELSGSRADLEALIGGEYRCRSFSYPMHAHDPEIMAAAQEAGYLAARDGGASPLGHPDFSSGTSFWAGTALYEVPITKTASWLTDGNRYTEAETRARTREVLTGAASRREWVVLFAHFLSDIDADHMRWILEEAQASGAWIDTFENVVAVYRAGHGPSKPGVPRPPPPPPEPRPREGTPKVAQTG